MEGEDEQTLFDIGEPLENLQMRSEDEILSLAADSVSQQFGNVDTKTMEEAKNAAKELITEADKEGMHELQKLMRATVAPAYRCALTQIAMAAGHKGSALVRMTTAIEKIAPVTGHGCMQIEFVDVRTGAASTAYIMLAECDSGYDFGPALRTLLAKLAPEREKEILDRCSILFNNGRHYYAATVTSHLPLVRKLARLSIDNPCKDFLTLKVDASRTTLYVNAEWPKRIGLIIKYKDELPPM